MMQEVPCDDPNGESTFEFVEDKLEGLNVTDEPTDVNLPNDQTQPSAPPATQVANMMPPPAALPQFVNFPTGYTTTTPSVMTPLPSTIAPNVPTPPPPTADPPIAPSPGGQAPNPYSRAALQHHQRPVYPNLETSSPVRYESPMVVQSQPTAIYTPTQSSTAVNLPFNEYETQRQEHVALYSNEGDTKGLFGWFRDMPGGEFISKVAEKAKSSVDTMITTLDPQMKEYIHSGGDVDLYVASNDEDTVSAVREAFQTIFGRATVRPISSQTPFAPQLVGFSAGMKAADERIQHLRKTLVVDEKQPLVAIDHFIAELTPERWFDLACLALHDPSRKIHLHVYTQPTPVPVEAVHQVQQETANDFAMRWSGFSVPIGSVLSQMYRVAHTEWHQVMCGITKRQLILCGAKTLATQYQLQMCNNS